MKTYPYNVSEYLHFHPVDDDISIGWNRYFPSVFIINEAALEILDLIRKGKEVEEDPEVDAFIEELKKFKFIYEADTDPSRQEFFDLVKQQLGRSQNHLQKVFAGKKGYKSFSISNDECNLGCIYCVNSYKKIFPPRPVPFKEKLELANRYLDAFIRDKAKHEQAKQDQAKQDQEKQEQEKVDIFFNGGEILLEFPLLKAIVERLLQQYGEINFSFGLNTNLTLMTDEIAEFLTRHKFDISISIDGYSTSHDRTRVYHDGKGSFQDVLKGLEILRKYQGESPTRSFQGTIQFLDGFEPEEVYRMDQYDLHSARLAPNVLDSNSDDAVEKARLMGRFLELNDKHPFQVTELFFTSAKRVINRDMYAFTFNCQGLSCIPEVGLQLNISSRRLSLMCSYISSVTVPVEEVEDNIYHPRLKEVTEDFIRRRTEALETVCGDCEMVGVCGGGCIYSGLDNQNLLNEGACAYQKEMWRIYTAKAYRDKKKKQEEQESATPENTETGETAEPEA